MVIGPWLALILLESIVNLVLGFLTISYSPLIPALLIPSLQLPTPRTHRALPALGEKRTKQENCENRNDTATRHALSSGKEIIADNPVTGRFIRDKRRRFLVATESRHNQRRRSRGARDKFDDKAISVRESRRPADRRVRTGSRNPPRINKT